MSQPKRIYGLMGYPVKHSLSPAMHNAAFKYLKEHGEIGYDAEYRLFEVEPQDLEDFLDNLEKNDIYGLNITIPLKVILLENKTIKTDASCLLAGAANTLKREANRLTCYNTDIKGFMDALREDLKFNTEGKNILILGCGGVSRAVVAGLATEGTGVKKIYLYDINKEAVESLMKHFYNIVEEKDKLKYLSSKKQIAGKIRGIDLLVNASPVGMKEGDSSVVDKSLFHEGLSIYDVVYNRETQLIKDAKSLGLSVVGGLSMLLYQGMKSFEIWTGKKAPKEVMWRALSSQISTK